ncbi:MAG: hypothetical protein R3B70_15325 [Polyangiaceae bacterium]
MRAHLFVSVLFAGSLLGGSALADRPGDDAGGRTTRMPHVRELRIRETREPVVREVRTPDVHQKEVRVPAALERLRAHGDMVDRNTSRGAAAGQRAAAAGDASAAKSQREADKALRRMDEKKHNAMNCSPTDDSCSPSARNAAAAARAAQQAESNKQRAEVQKMINERRAQKMKEMLMKQVCEKQANMCSDNL